MIMSKALATYFATVNDIPDTEFKVEILEDGPIKKVSVNGTVYDVDYNLGGDTIHSIIMNHKSHGVQISSVGDSTYEVKNKGDYYQKRSKASLILDISCTFDNHNNIV